LPRDLSDVLHYFLPELEAGDESAASPPSAAKPPLDASDAQPGEHQPQALSSWPILALPVGERDVVRASLTWNLAVEIARRGASACVLAPSTEGDSPLWPSAGVGPLGTELHLHPAKTLEDLYTAARDLARRSADHGRGDGLVFVCIPPGWLERGEPIAQPFDWLLLLTSSRQRDLQEAYALIRRLLDSNPEIEIGVTRPSSGSRAPVNTDSVSRPRASGCSSTISTSIARSQPSAPSASSIRRHRRRVP
jgi:hypothetical protein